MAELIRWNHAGVAYSWDGLTLSAFMLDQGERFAALRPDFGAWLLDLAARPSPEGASRAAMLAAAATGALLDGSDSRAAASLLARAKAAAERAVDDVRALVAAHRFTEAENIVVAIEGLALNQEQVQP